MTVLRTLRAKVLAWLGLRHRDDDLRDEIDAHIEALTEAHVRRGLRSEDARTAARREFGGVEQVKETYRERRGLPAAESVVQDVRYAIRMALRHPGFTVVVVLTLALGVGANTAIFSVTHSVLLQPLPFADGHRIVRVYETWREFRTGSASAGHFHDWTSQGTVFDATAATQAMTYNLSGAEPERVSGMRATPGYFRVFYAAPIVGRYFTEDDLASDPHVVVLGYSFWRRRFAGDAAVVGREIRLNYQPYTVVGVLPSEYELTAASPQIVTPLVFAPDEAANYGSHALSVAAKLRSGITLAAAQEDMERVTHEIAKTHPREMEGRSVSVRPLDQMLFGDFRRPLFLLLAAVIVVLFIGCLNVANLLLARASTRRREIAIRLSIGGGEWRIVRQLLTESVVLAVAGGVTGVGVAHVGIRLLKAFGPSMLPRLNNAGLHSDVLAFATALTLLTAIVFGLLPAFRATRQSLVSALSDGGRTSFPGTGRDRVRSVLVVCEIATAIVLLVGAGLFMRSAWRLHSVPLGFDTNHLLTARLALPAARYGNDSAVTTAYGRIIQGLRSTQGIRHAGASTAVPFGGGVPNASMFVEGRTVSLNDAPSPSILLVTDGYIEAIGMRVMRGRAFNSADMTPGAVRTAVINDRLANLAWPGENPIGKRLTTWSGPDTPEWREVVGIVADVRSAGLDEAPVAELMLPYTQTPEGAWTAFQRSMALVVRTAGDPSSHAADIRRVVRAVDASLPVFLVQTMQEAVGASGAGARFTAWLFAMLAGTGLVLATVGIYGVIAYFVTLRAPEIAVRLALGASPRAVLMMVVWHGAFLTAVGIVLGIGIALGVTRVASALLFEITPTDPPTYLAVAATLSAVGLASCAIPAIRATRVNPMRSLGSS